VYQALLVVATFVRASVVSTSESAGITTYQAPLHATGTPTSYGAWIKTVFLDAYSDFGRLS
jgi:hypothetical protein